MRVAILHDWLVTWRGGEKCLEEIYKIYPEAVIFTFFYDKDLVEKNLSGSTVISIPFGGSRFLKKYYQLLLPLYPVLSFFLAKRIKESHNLKNFDLVISISHCWVKNVRVPKTIPHICYCLTPVRYVWDQFDVYLKDKWYKNLAEIPRFFLKILDIKGSKRVTKFISISSFVSSRISKYYGRDSSVVFPPVSKINNIPQIDREDFFLVVNALVPYKNTKNIVEAFNKLGLPLKIVGTGSEELNLKSIANTNISFLGNISREKLEDLYRRAKAMIFMAEEDFGITPVEAMSTGIPIIYLAFGGVNETLGANNYGIGINKTTPSEIEKAVLLLNINYENYLLSCNNQQNFVYEPDKFKENFINLTSKLSD